MMISFRTKLFDTASIIPEGAYYGEDLAKWLAARLVGWSVGIVPEDWGWAVTGRKDQYRYIFGVYDHDATDVTDRGARWVLRLYNQKDRSNWIRKLFKYIPPSAHQEVTEEIVRILRSNPGIEEISVEPL